MCSTRNTAGPRIRTGLALALLCYAGAFACRDDATAALPAAPGSPVHAGRVGDRWRYGGATGRSARVRGGVVRDPGGRLRRLTAATHLGYQCGTSLCAVRDDGADRRTLLARSALPNAADFAYELSPDGRTILFTRLTYLGPDAPASDVYVMNADGTGERRLGPGDAPQWSPVGRSVAFASARDGARVREPRHGLLRSRRRQGRHPPRHPAGLVQSRCRVHGERVVVDAVTTSPRASLFVQRFDLPQAARAVPALARRRPRKRMCPMVR
jgi:hypothetical protein